MNRGAPRASRGPTSGRARRGALVALLWGCATGDSGDTGPIDSADTGEEAERRLGRAALAEQASVTGEAAGDQAGASVSGLGDLDGDGIGDLIVGAPGAGVAYVVLGPLPAASTLADADGKIDGGGDFGACVTGAGDLDGDGRDDFAVGAPHVLPGGVAYAFRGPEANPSVGDAWMMVAGRADGDALGTRVAPAGDWDGDGRADLLIGAWLADDAGEDAGAVAVVVALDGGVRNLAAPGDLLLTGEAGGDWAGYGARGGGDVDGDGHADLVVGADGTDVPASNTGSAYLVRGPLAGVHLLGDAGLRFNGEAGGDNAGHAVALVPDTDGDGKDDLAAGALGNGATARRAGAAYLLRDPQAAGPLADGAVVVRGPATFDHFGYSLAGLGDVDGDGLGDLLVGARFDATGGTDAGAAWLLYGPIDPTLDLAATAAHLAGNPAEEAGYTLGAGADVTGDGRLDGLVGAPQADGEVGRVYIVTGVR